mmetsp:Transcript_74675/g.148406  ORF Transcript_74675/g.148406 Transcript_74675/m.148406 type:complete len:308 (-) Transcript_74675:240-1163(-)|eukprot:CAMPEP_0174697102 /NCGR_PEP_ID=MMETSP1094-20130205/3063_1 /TAXON_ID=156173 /ORGANISM="Chrysochromulina brevifilum, Strain UTEX LB 985" /LENGTH=307 /DNA_ID=CAMNT_0015894019 /DNA_START=62 /DNA_END=985 /DNA_ORIENTATION=-
MPSRAQSYAASIEPDTLDDLTKKLAADLRLHVQKIQSYAAFSQDWMAMIDSLVHIANVAKMEHRLPRAEGSATLWDEDELTVRFVLEEGKMNLLLHLMQTFSQSVAAKQPGTPGYEQWLTHTARDCEAVDANQLRARLLTFEQCLGTLIHCALQHVEAVQTTDLQLLMAHCAEVLQACAATPGSLIFDQTQVALVPRYLNSVLIRAEQLDEDRVMGLVGQYGLVDCVCTHLSVHHTKLGTESLLAGASFLASAFDTEAFHTDSKIFLSEESASRLQTYKAAFLTGLLSDSEQRKRFRPLLDVIDRGS